jgi:hypothetical protein
MADMVLDTPVATVPAKAAEAEAEAQAKAKEQEEVQESSGTP